MKRAGCFFWCLWILATLLVSTSVHGVPVAYYDYHQRLWNTRDGMPQVSAIAITQDHQGYIWVATEGGLARFDGHHFEVYDGQFSPLFANPLLRSLYFSSDQTLWIGSSSRLIRFRDNQLTEFLYQGESTGAIEVMAEFGDSLYAGGQGLYKVELSGHQASLESQSEGFVTAMLATPELLWVAYSDKLASIDVDGRYQSIALTGLLPHQQIKKLAWYQGKLMMGTTKGLYYLSDNTELVPFLVEGTTLTDPVHMLHVDRYDSLWVASGQQLLQIHQDVVVATVGRMESTSVPWFVTAYEDNQGYLWFGSRTHGLHRLRYDGTAHHSVASGLGDPFVWSVIKGKDVLWVGTNDGLYQWDGRKFTKRPIDHHLPNPVVYSQLVSSDGHHWLGTRSGLVVIDQQGQEVKSFPNVSHVGINGIVETADKIVWIATTEGIFRWDGIQLENYTERMGLRNNRVRMVYIDDQQRLWVGTTRGLYVHHGDQTEQVNDPVLMDASISYITQLSDGRMLIGTFQSGLAVQAEESEWYKLDKTTLPAESVMFAAQYNNDLLVSSLKGVYKLSLASLQPSAPVNASVIIDDFGAEAAIDGVRCCNGAGNTKGLLHDDKLFLPSLDGLVMVDLLALPTSQARPKVWMDKVASHSTIFRDKRILLELGMRNLNFSYSSPWFYRNSALRYRYQLVGYDEQWQEVGTRKEAFYTNLPAGEYVFRVQVKLSDTREWSESDSVTTLLPPYWYETLWAKLLGILSLMGMFALLYMFRLRQLEKSQQRLSHLVAERTQALRDANLQLQQASLTDSLTGLHNRRYLDQYTDNLLARAKRQKQRLYCILLDVDNFKQINDQLGHQAGDDLLVALAEVLRQQVRSADHVVRWGGEEFLILLDSATSIDEFMERLMQAIQDYSWPHRDALPNPMSISAGVCCHPVDDLMKWRWSTTLVLADKAMYLVKRHGKNGWLYLQVLGNAPEDISQQIAKMKPEPLLHSGWFAVIGSARARVIA